MTQTILLLVLAFGFAASAVAAWIFRRLSQSQMAELIQLREQSRQHESARIRAESELQAFRESSEEARQRLTDSFKSLAADALKGNNQQFLELAKSELSRESGLAKAELEKRQQAIGELVKPLADSLDKYNVHINAIEKDRQKSYFSIENEMKKVIDSTALLSRETTALKDALKRPHVRGRWGEVQLRNCVELAGMSEFADVTFQDFSTDEEGQRHIPDMTVRMPGGHVVIVDAKTPADAFYSALEATTDEARNAEMSRHGRHVKEHVKKLSTRAYAESIKESADFTVMFLPNESFLYAALESEPDLMEFALQRKVLIATPPTLVGLLKVIRFGWNEEKLAENAVRISEAGQELHKRLCDFVEAFMEVGRHLDKAKSEYDIGLKRLESRVLVQARRLEDLGVKGPKSLPEGLGSLPEPAAEV